MEASWVIGMGGEVGYGWPEAHGTHRTGVFIKCGLGWFGFKVVLTLSAARTHELRK